MGFVRSFRLVDAALQKKRRLIRLLAKQHVDNWYAQKI